MRVSRATKCPNICSGNNVDRDILRRREKESKISKVLKWPRERTSTKCQSSKSNESCHNLLPESNRGERISLNYGRILYYFVWSSDKRALFDFRFDILFLLICSLAAAYWIRLQSTFFASNQFPLASTHVVLAIRFFRFQFIVFSHCNHIPVLLCKRISFYWCSAFADPYCRKLNFKMKWNKTLNSCQQRTWKRKEVTAKRNMSETYWFWCLFFASFADCFWFRFPLHV